MNKKWKWVWIIMPVLFLLVIAIILLNYRLKAAYSISVIGGADGPTSIFIAGKLGDNDKNIDEKAVQEQNRMKIEIQIGNTVKIAELDNNVSTEELVTILSEGELKMSASNYGGFEKVCTIGQSISRDDKQTTTKPGDIMLYNGSQLVIFYDSNSWAYTPVGHIDESTDELEKFLSGDESEVVIRLAQ